MIKTKIPFSQNHPFTKPTHEQLIEDTQLFSRDASTKSGAKMFLIKSYEEMYDIIKTDKIKCYYEDHTYNNKIKLHIDIDVNCEYNDCIDRDTHIDLILDNLLPLLNTQIKDTFNIDKPQIIILISNTLLKLSIHIIYLNVIFGDIYSMGYFYVDNTI